MGYFEDRGWDLSKERPKVLFLGNGLFHEECDWDSFIKNNRNSRIDDVVWNNIKDSPYTIRASVALDKEDSIRLGKYKSTINDIHKKEIKNKTALTKILNIPFDAILTTNYTYQIEQGVIGNFYGYSDKTKGDKFAKSTFSRRKGVKYDTKYLLQTFNYVSKGKITHKVWHIHGEARRPSSIVATHDEYGKLMEKIREYIANNGARYENEYLCLKFKSWIDYLIMGDVYFVGFKLDYTEFDLWWLLSRRIREKAKIGKYVYYEPKEETIEKETVLKLLHIDWHNLGFDKKCVNYSAFYDLVIEDLAKEIK